MRYDTATQVLHASIFIPNWQKISEYIYNADRIDFISIANI